MQACKSSLLLWLLVTLLVLSSRVAGDILSADDYLKFAVVKADKRIHYGSDPLQFGDLWIPDGPGPFPVVIVIHGGCWREAFDLEPVSEISARLGEHGVAVWSLEYRRVGNAGGGWPGTFVDVAKGADFLRVLAQDYPLDLARVVVTGHSAGGHLALWLAARPRLDEQSDLYVPDPINVHAVVPLAPVPDMRGAVRDIHQSEACDAAILAVMGGHPDQVPQNYPQGSPLEMLPLGIPQHIITGLQDDPALVTNVRRYYAAALDAGDDIKLTLLEKAGHFEVVSGHSREWPTIRDIILEFAF